MKLWDKNIQTDKLIEQFTVGKDRELDLLLAPYDVLGSLAHIQMLEHIGLLRKEEWLLLRNELITIYNLTRDQLFVIEPESEDVHTQVEVLLTRKLGDTGKKIHAARSRNDQVLVDIKLFIRDRIQEIAEQTQDLFDLLINRSNELKDLLIPGYTHLQVAMPSSFGLWLGGYAESLIDDMRLLQAAYNVADQNPLGSAAGYGSSFPIDRQMTTDLLGFSSMNYNVINAQMSRGKTERIVSFALASLASTVSRLANDICLFNSQNFGFISLPDEMTTGSSIMPHKKNPDVFELIRSHCNRIQALPAEISNMMINLPSGYFRDMQVIKEVFLPVFDSFSNCLKIATYAVSGIKPAQNVLSDEKYRYVFSVEEVNKLVLQGIPFREAYKMVAKTIAEDTYNPAKTVNHTHAGSIGNLCNDLISEKMKSVMQCFDFGKKDMAFRRLLER
jgi:argininosuccinate lyase